MFAVASKLCALFQESGVAAGDFLRKFLFEIGGLPSLPEDVVWSMLYFKSKTEFLCKDSSRHSVRGRKQSR